MTAQAQTVLNYARELYGRGVEARVGGKAGDWYRFRVTPGGELDVEAGSCRGVLYAVYDALGGRCEGAERPEFSIRGLNPCESLNRHTPEQIAALIDRMGRWRMNTLIVHSNYGYAQHRDLIEREAARRGIEITHYTYSNLCFMAGIGPGHFAKGADGRPMWEHAECETRLCVSDTEGLEAYAANIRHYLAKHPDYGRMLFCTADGCDLCRCPSCRSKNAIAQWQSIFDPFFDVAHGTRKLEMLVYVQRFSLPPDLSRVERLDRVLFDTHLRFPCVPLGSPHAWMERGMRFLWPPEQDLIQDPRGDQPINVYLWDRLVEWRKAFRGQLYVFENLMIQGIWGCPRPNTSVYLDDLKRFKDLGIDGVVYEAFEPGIQPFLPTFDAIARAMWDVCRPYQKGAFEQAYLAEGAVSKDLSIDHPGHARWNRWHGDDARAGLAVLQHRLEALQMECPPGKARSAEVVACCREILRHVLDRPGREDFDWILIAFSVLKTARRFGALDPANDREEDFLAARKLWDFQERHAPPREAASEVIASLWARLGRSQEESNP